MRPFIIATNVVGEQGLARVEADYFRIEHGHLILRKQRANAQSYPETVRVFAPGSWFMIKPADCAGPEPQGCPSEKCDDWTKCPLRSSCEAVAAGREP